jgi:hypothetical protein
MLHISTPPDPYKANQRRLARLRHKARQRGFRILRDGTGNFSVIDIRIEPPRALLGLDHAPLWVIEQAIFAPLPEPPPRRKRMTRPAESAQNAEALTYLLDLRERQP